MNTSSSTFELVRICKALLADEIGSIEASRKIRSLSFRILDDPYKDDDFVIFLGFESETDHLPVGEGRAGWAADSLLKKDLEVAQFEGLFRQQALVSARALIRKFDTAEQGAAANL